MKPENNMKLQQSGIGKTAVLITGFVLMFLITLLLAEPSHAQTIQGLANNISSQFMSIYSSIGIVVSAIATVALAICAIKWILASDPQAVRQAKQWMLYIAIGIAVYWLAGVIVDVIKNMSSGSAPAETSEAESGKIVRWFLSI